MAEENQMGAAKSDRNSSEEHEIDSLNFYYLAHVELKIYCIPIIIWIVILCSVQSMVNARISLLNFV